jgi:hypothetical protein
MGAVVQVVELAEIKWELMEMEKEVIMAQFVLFMALTDHFHQPIQGTYDGTLYTH